MRIISVEYYTAIKKQANQAVVRELRMVMKPRGTLWGPPKYKNLSVSPFSHL